MRNIVIYPRRGDPPPAPAGYVPTSDPFVFELPWVACSHRRFPQAPCGGCGTRVASEADHSAWCQLKDEPCDRVACHYCKEQSP